MCQRDVGFPFRHLPIAYADKVLAPNHSGRHGITPTGRALFLRWLLLQQSHRPLHPTREVRHTTRSLSHIYTLRLGYEAV